METNFVCPVCNPESEEGKLLRETNERINNVNSPLSPKAQDFWDRIRPFLENDDLSKVYFNIDRFAVNGDRRECYWNLCELTMKNVIERFYILGDSTTSSAIAFKIDYKTTCYSDDLDLTKLTNPQDYHRHFSSEFGFDVFTRKGNNTGHFKVCCFQHPLYSNGR